MRTGNEHKAAQEKEKITLDGNKLKIANPSTINSFLTINTISKTDKIDKSSSRLQIYI